MLTVVLFKVVVFSTEQVLRYFKYIFNSDKKEKRKDPEKRGGSKRKS